jgi:pSer/pThr/pTyr-binding forkhead associated (FHA) protein
MTDLPGLILLGLRFGLAICLFLFLFWAIRLLWKDLNNLPIHNNSTKSLLHLKVLIDDKDSITYNLSSIENLLGRAPECNIQLENNTVSNIHARIYYSHAQWWIEDLGSSNGTFLNGREILQPTVLTDQDQLEFGSLTSIVEIS